jgi:hypothetical protein
MADFACDFLHIALQSIDSNREILDLEWLACVLFISFIVDWQLDLIIIIKCKPV